jgi:hypothetical protein
MWTKFRTWLCNWLLAEEIKRIDETIYKLRSDHTFAGQGLNSLWRDSRSLQDSHKETRQAFENFRDSVIIDVGTQNAIIAGLVERMEAVEEVQYTADVKPKQRKRKKI